MHRLLQAGLCNCSENFCLVESGGVDEALVNIWQRLSAHTRFRTLKLRTNCRETCLVDDVVSSHPHPLLTVATSSQQERCSEAVPRLRAVLCAPKIARKCWWLNTFVSAVDAMSCRRTINMFYSK